MEAHEPFSRILGLEKPRSVGRVDLDSERGAVDAPVVSRIRTEVPEPRCLTSVGRLVLLCGLLGCAWALGGCSPKDGGSGGASPADQQPSAPEEIDLGEGVWVIKTRGADPFPGGPPISAGMENGEIHCESALGEEVIRFWTFQQQGDRSAYGVYGLGRAKNPMEVPPPLEGSSVTYADLSPPAALARIARETGGPDWSDRVTAGITRNLCCPGLRVVFVLRGDRIPTSLSENGARCVLWAVELDVSEDESRAGR